MMIIEGITTRQTNGGDGDLRSVKMVCCLIELMYVIKLFPRVCI